MAFPFIGDLINGVSSILDTLHTSDEEKLQAKIGLTELHIRANEKVLAYESTLAKERAATIRTEGASNHWLAANWRPLTMLIFTGLIVAHWLGYTAPNLSEAVVLSLLGLVKIGLGGYIGGRTLEKVVPAVVGAFKAKDNV